MRQSDLQFIPAVFDRVEVRALCKRAELSHTKIREATVSPPPVRNVFHLSRTSELHCVR